MPTTFQALLILVLFIVPGFIMMQTFTGARAYSERSDLKFVIQSALFGSLIHIFFAWWTIELYSSYVDGALLTDSFGQFYLWLAVVIFAAPALAGTIAGRLARNVRISAWFLNIGIPISQRVPTAWDEVFQDGCGYWVIIELVDGSKVGGKYSTNSAVATSPSSRDIYIEEVYNIDENDSFGDAMVGTKGAWVDGTQIKLIKFFE